LVLYREWLKKRKFGKEAPQNFCSEQVTIALSQGASENKNFEEKPTEPKTDSSITSGISPDLYHLIFIDKGCIIGNFALQPT
jgi:hypothetical protein